MKIINYLHIPKSVFYIFIAMILGGCAGLQMTEQKRQWLAEKEYESRQSSSGNFSFLGAVAQGAANAGGKNASQYQAVADSLNQNRNASDQESSGKISTPTSNQNPKIGNSSDSFAYAEGVNNCLVTEPEPSLKGTNRWRNQCAFKISITYCSVKSSGNGCASRQIGAEQLEAWATTFRLREEIRTNHIVCRYPYYVPSNRITWQGEQFNGQCQATK